MSGHGGKLQLDQDEIKLIIASIEMMGRLIREDSGVSAAEKQKVYDTGDRIKRKFHNAYFHDPRLVIVDPDGFVAH